MKKYTVLTLALVLATAVLHAQTNETPTPPVLSTNAAPEEGGKDYGSFELTLGGDGITDPKTGNTSFAFDVSLSTNPFKKLSSLWIGVEQSIAWEPKVLASSSVFTEWSFNIYKEKLYLNTGWNVGLDYGAGVSSVWHTGPHASLQYYTSDSAFVFVGAKYNLMEKGNNDLPFFCGIGLAF